MVALLLLFELLRGFQILASEAAQNSSGSTCWMVALCSLGKVGVLVELGLEPLDFLEVREMKAARASSPFRFATAEGVQSRPWDFMKLSSFCTAVSSFSMTTRGLVHEPDFPRLLTSLFAAEEGDGGIDGVLLLAEVEMLPWGLWCR